MDSTVARRTERSCDLGYATLNRFRALWLSALLLSLLPLPSHADLVSSGNVEAELISEMDAVVPGAPMWVGLRLVIRPGWHTYWRNPGDSGAPTRLAWRMPEGISAGELQWPRPERIPYGPLMNYGYHGEVIFPVQLTVASTLAGESVTLQATGRWLVCADVCIPESAELTLTLPVASISAENPSTAAWFAAARQQIPADIGVQSRYRLDGNLISLDIDFPGLVPGRIQSVAYFPYEPAVIDYPAPQGFRLTDAGLQLTLTRSIDDDRGATMAGVVVIAEGDSLTSAFEINPERDGAATGQGETHLTTAILFALLGGMILNLMPCVFPVLSIKILALVQQAGTEAGEIRLHGWVYLAGVVISFVLVAAALLIIRAGGEYVGWGFQLQSPGVVGVLAYLFFLIGLNLAGYYEFGGRIMGLGQGYLQQGGLAGSFFTGVLATVVAAPCTAPFMASAIGFALLQPTIVTLTIFAALGTGMAIPYLLLCYSPALLQRLPRPGAWMVRFKELLAFPMFASAIWLVWVLSQQAGPNGVLAVLAGMLMLALALWLSNHRGRGTASRWLTLAIALALAAVALALPIRLHREVPVSVAGTAVAVDTGYDGPHWETWSQERLAAMRATGPVFVNFMAAWCITCKVNEAVALDSMTIRDAFERKGVQYLKGDWTNEDPDITRALAEYERSGVPLYLLYRQGEGRATVLPQILTESTVLAAIEGL